MSQLPVIYLVELSGQGAGLAKTLGQSGFTAQVMSIDQLLESVERLVPQALVSPHTKADAIAAILRDSGAAAEGLTFFAMAPESAGIHVKGAMPREVTAVVRDDIDPGILSLRLKAATQQIPTRRRHSSTLMGYVPPSGANIPKSLVTPAAEPTAASPPAAFPSSDTAGSVPSTPPVSLPPTRATLPAISSSAQSVPPSEKSSSSGKISSHTGDEQVADPTALTFSEVEPGASMAAVDTSSRAAPVGSMSSSATTLRAGPSQNENTGAEAAAIATQAAEPSGAIAAEPLPNFKGTSKFDPKIKWFAAAAGIVMILGVGASVALRGGKSDSLAPQSAVAPESAPAVPALAKAPPSEPVPPPEPIKEPANEEKLEQIPNDNELFKVSSVSTLDDCEKVLSKPEAYYKKLPKWRSVTAWKNARKFLVQGKEAAAFEQMCQSAIVDPGGQAVAGIVNFFLRNRALDQARVWAEKAVAAPKSSRSAKETLGDVLNQLGKVDEGKALWLEAVRLNDSTSSTRLAAVARNWLKLAKKARHGGDSALAERLLRRAAVFDEKNSETALELGLTLQKNEQPLLAKNWAKKALELDPESKEAQTLLDELK